MKLVDSPDLELVSQKMRFESDKLTISVRIELYSCKYIRNDRKLLKNCIDDDFEELSYLGANQLSLELKSPNKSKNSSIDIIPSPTSTQLFYTPYYRDDLTKLNPYKTHVGEINGRISMKIDKKTLCNLRTILKYFYNDDKYLETPSIYFHFIDDLDEIICEIKGSLQDSIGNQFNHELHEEFWHTQDDVIDFANCEKYQYQPPVEEDNIFMQEFTLCEQYSDEHFIMD